MRHRHSWKIVEKTEQPSPIEIATLTGVTKIEGTGDFITFNTRPIIVTYRCACGAEKVARI